MPRKYPKAEIGQVFGKWTVVGEGGKNKSGNRMLLCRCECGREKRVRESHLKSGASTQCDRCGVRKLSKGARAWATKRTTDAAGYTSSVTEAARTFGVSVTTANRRARKGQDPFSCRQLPSIKINGQLLTLNGAARTLGINHNTVRTRLRRGWTLPQALGIEPPPPRRRRK